MILGGIRVWDLPTRLLHWAIVLLIPALWATHKLHLMDVHILLGETMLGLVIFRLIWGVIGSSTARFAGFVHGPGAILRYLRSGQHALGHNPLGALSVVAMLLVLSVQIGLGLFASDEDNLYLGPLSGHVTEETSHILRDRHETFFYVLLAVIAVHLAAILYYRLAKGERLVEPMITGRTDWSETGEEMIPAPAWRFWLAVALALGFTVAVANVL